MLFKFVLLFLLSQKTCSSDQTTSSMVVIYATTPPPLPTTTIPTTFITTLGPPINISDVISTTTPPLLPPTYTATTQTTTTVKTSTASLFLPTSTTTQSSLSSPTSTASQAIANSTTNPATILSTATPLPRNRSYLGYLQLQDSSQISILLQQDLEKWLTARTNKSFAITQFHYKNASNSGKQKRSTDNTISAIFMVVTNESNFYEKFYSTQFSNVEQLRTISNFTVLKAQLVEVPNTCDVANLCSNSNNCSVDNNSAFNCNFCGVTSSCSPTTPPPSSSSSNKLLALIVIPCVAVLVIIIVLIVYFVRRRKVQRHKEDVVRIHAAAYENSSYLDTVKSGVSPYVENGFASVKSTDFADDSDLKRQTGLY